MNLESRIKILVVDDDPKLLLATSRVLSQGGYEVIEASSGATGLKLAREHTPDMAVVDIVLPDMDGRELCEIIKSDPKLSNTFVVLLSGIRTSSLEQADGLEIGADEFIARPLSNRELLARINAMVRLKRSEDALRKSRTELALRNRIAEIFLTTPDSEVFSEVLNLVLEKLDSQYGLFCIIDENGDIHCPTLSKTAWSQCRLEDKDITSHYRNVEKQRWLKELVEEKKCLSDLSFQVSDGHVPIKNSLVCPIVHHEKVIGILQIAGGDSSYGEPDRRLLRGIADYLAPILMARLERDNLEQRQFETFKELQHAKELAEAAEITKSKFLAAMSHELRTPLNSIIGFSEVLADENFGPLTIKQKKYVDNVQKSGKYLLALIDDILELSGLMTSQTEVNQSPAVVEKLLKTGINMILKKAAESDIRIETKIEPDLSDRRFLIDKLKFIHIIFNLLSNAVRFTSEGGRVEIEARRVTIEKSRAGPEPVEKSQTAKNPGNFLEFSVSDNGIGILEKDMDKIFDEFYQVKGDMVGKTPGAGLGLALAKRYVEIQGGKIRAESDGADKGSRFVFLLPDIEVKEGSSSEK